MSRLLFFAFFSIQSLFAQETATTKTPLSDVFADMRVSHAMKMRNTGPGGLEFEVSKDAANFVDVGVGIPFYVQILRDYARRKAQRVMVLNGSQVVFDSNKNQDETQPEKYVRNIFEAIFINTVKKMATYGVEYDRVQLMKFIHLLLASRTQTFSADGLEFIYSQLKDGLNADHFRFRYTQGTHLFLIHDLAIEAKSLFVFDVIDVQHIENVDVIGQIFLESRLMSSLTHLKFKNEIYSLHKGKYETELLPPIIENRYRKTQWSFASHRGTLTPFKRD